MGNICSAIQHNNKFEWTQFTILWNVQVRFNLFANCTFLFFSPSKRRNEYHTLFLTLRKEFSNIVTLLQLSLEFMKKVVGYPKFSCIRRSNFNSFQTRLEANEDAPDIHRVRSKRRKNNNQWQQKLPLESAAGTTSALQKKCLQAVTWPHSS